MFLKKMKMKKGGFRNTIILTVFAVLLSAPAFAVRDYYPTSITAQPTGATYCQNAAATALGVTIIETNCGSGASNTVSRTYTWYETTTNCSGGAVVQTTTNTLLTNSYTPPTTTVGTKYYYCVISWGVGPNCAPAGSLTSNCATIVVNTCASYCASNATSTADEDVFNVTFGTLNNSSTCATTGGAGSILNEYSNYTAVAAPNVTQSATVAFSVQIGTCGGNYSNAIKIFIDYNQDGDFADPGEQVYVSAASTVGPHTETGNITIPAAATLGNTRMRVVNVETGTPSTISACGTYTWGETEDYTINIVTSGPMVYSSCTTTQSVISGVEKCSNDQQIIGVEVVTTGSSSPLTLTNFVINMTGSTIPGTNTNDVTKIHIYYTGTSNVFSATGAFDGTGTNVAAGAISVTGSQTLTTGTNYFWISYDINATSATIGNLLDAQCTQITVSAVPQVPTVTSPAGTRSIIACPPYPGAGSTNIKLWLKSNAGVTGSPAVTQWNDNSGAGVTGNFVVQPGAPAQSSPTLVNNAVNYNPYVSFNGGTNSMASNNSFTGNSMYDPNNNTMFMVHNLKGGIVYWKWETAGVGNYRVGYERNANSVRFDFVNDGVGQNSVSSTSVLNKDVLVTTTTDATNSVVRLNGNVDATKNISAAGSFSPGVTARPMAIGNNDLATNNLPSQIDYAEIITYNTKLSATQVNMVESYLAIKYGITLGNNQGAGACITYRNSNGIPAWNNQTGYHNNVTGIGRDDASTLDQRMSRGVLSLNASLDLVTIVNGTFAAPVAFTSNLSTLIVGHNAATPQTVWGDPSFSNYPAALGASAARIQRVWKAQATNFAQSVSIGFESSMLIAWSPVSNLRLLVDDDGNFANGGTTIYSGAVLNGTRIEFSGITNLGNTGNLYFSLATINYTATPLPVTLTAFSGMCNNGIITLQWTTQSETNNNFFTIERSEDGMNFYQVAIAEGAGTTSQVNNYSWTDEAVANGTVYYRLSQTDNNGTLTVMRIIVVQSCEINNSVLLYPNPTSGSGYFVFPANDGDKIDLFVYDALGRQLFTIAEQKTFEEGIHQEEINLTDEAPGVYFVRFARNGVYSTYRIIRE